MIAYLSGKILEKGKDFVLLQAGPIGYKVTVSSELYDNLRKDTNAVLYVHEAVRDDGREFFGFINFRELEFFWKLIDISGVGARVALQLLSLGSVDTVQSAIEKGDVIFIASAKGVGKKTAQRVVLELQGKLVGEDGPIGGSGEIVSALENLGYSGGRARQAAASVPQEGSTEERIKFALRLLSK